MVKSTGFICHLLSLLSLFLGPCHLCQSCACRFITRCHVYRSRGCYAAEATGRWQCRTEPSRPQPSVGRWISDNHQSVVKRGNPCLGHPGLRSLQGWQGNSHRCCGVECSQIRHLTGTLMNCNSQRSLALLSFPNLTPNFLDSSQPFSRRSFSYVLRVDLNPPNK